MSGVVLRCPSCGTTKTSLGECQACHEAQVRYYCADHTPGQWLDAAACPQCGARFGEPGPPPTPPPPARPPVSPPAASLGRRRSVPWLPDKTGGPWARRTRRLEPEGRGERPYGSGPAPRVESWPELLREAASRARRMRDETRPVPDPVPDLAALSGCLMRGVYLVVMLVVAFTMFSVLAGGFMTQGF